MTGALKQSKYISLPNPLIPILAGSLRLASITWVLFAGAEGVCKKEVVTLRVTLETRTGAAVEERTVPRKEAFIARS